MKFLSFTLVFFLYVSSAWPTNFLHVIDVKYGQAVLIQSGNRNYLFDTGPKESSSKVLQFLADQTVTHLHGVFISHAHWDHVGALLKITQFIKTDQVYWNDLWPPNEALVSDIEKVKSFTNFKILEPGVHIQLGRDLSLSVLNSNIKTQDLNDNSLIFGLTYGKSKLLMMGDAGRERQIDLVHTEKESLHNIQWFLWPHHGDSLIPELKEALNMIQYCVVSVGENEYGLPRTTLNKESKQFCQDLLRTDLHGDLTFALHKKVSLVKRSSPSKVKK